MSEEPQAEPKTVIVNDPIDPPARPAGRRGLGVPTRTAREAVPLNTALRRAGIDVQGIHRTDDRGQYDASGKLGPNDPCRCAWAAEHPHKFKRHEKVAGPLVREQLDKAIAAARAKVDMVPMAKVEPTVSE